MTALGRRTAAALRAAWEWFWPPWGSPGKIMLFSLLGLAVAGAGYLFAAPLLEIGGVDAPAARPVQVLRLDQGWPATGTQWYHHASQGTRILPYDWFLALEQPVLTPLPVGRFADRGYLARFGFLHDGPAPGPGGDDLPVGFAVEETFSAPYATPPVRTPTRVVGLTCAACHTGRLDVRLADGTTRGVLVEGGSAMINLALFQDAVGRSLYYTSLFRDRFQRFARRVLNADRPDGDPRKEALRDDLAAYIASGLASQHYAKEHKLVPLEAGFSRTDALGLIGNRVFGVMAEANQVVTDAPVNFPHLWDTPWFDWVQYNASIRTPLARNVGEALGVGAVVNLDPARGPLYESTVNVPNLIALEDFLGGPAPFRGLWPPLWDDFVAKVFGSTAKAPPGFARNPELAREGRVLYREHCEGCHMPPRDVLRASLEAGAADSPWFTAPDPASKKRFLRLRVVDLNVVGTDPNQALNFYRRVAVSPFPRPADGGHGPNWSETISAEDGLFRVTSFLRRDALRAAGLLAPGTETDPAKRAAYDGDPKRKDARLAFDRFRSVSPELDVGDEQAIGLGRVKAAVIVANLGYKARPLHGIWATPPYFHNGSVPNLHEVLLPAARRSARFALGSRRFDPVRVGYETERFPGATVMDTSLAGNHNTGHEYRDLTLDELEAARKHPWDGASGREERWAFVLGVSPAELAALTPDQRRQAVHKASVEALKTYHVKGVLGAELDDRERRSLVEFLKSL